MVNDLVDQGEPDKKNQNKSADKEFLKKMDILACFEICK